MKIHIVFLLVSLLPTFGYADCLPEAAEAANNFMNAYKNYSDDVMAGKTQQSVEQWLNSNAVVSTSFKRAYKKLVADANKDDPELGLDFDPILNAQDYPEQGFEVRSCDEKSNFVRLKGKNTENFDVVVKVESAKGKWSVMGAGVVNIPENKQAKR